jgi:hypothetical protein
MIPIIAVTTVTASILFLWVHQGAGEAFTGKVRTESAARLIQELRAVFMNPEELPAGQYVRKEDMDLIERPNTRIKRPAMD